MAEKSHKTVRIISVVAAVAISLGCGTNYAYSAWAPQFAERLQLSATQSNIIGTAANIGMYASGIPNGHITDKKGPRASALLGTIALAVGYFPIKAAYDAGPGSMNVALISLFSFLTGAGSCAAFQAALKTVALNWPLHRGTATAFPLAAFGLSALFYTMIAQFFFHDNTSGLLLLLSVGTSGLVLISIPFLNVVDHHAIYAAVPTSESRPKGPRRNSNLLHRTKSGGSKYSTSSLPNEEPADNDPPETESSESSSLLSGPGDIDAENDGLKGDSTQHSHKLDIRGLAMLSHIEFWQLWILLGLLTGVGLMTINNIGHDAQALWSHYDDTASKAFIAKRQLMHVSIISGMSFLGRLSSGIGSDLIVKKLHMSRFWCVALSALVFLVGQICATRIENPNRLWAVSGITGLAYGFLFGVFPSLVADAFGMPGFAVNWGFMTLAPVVSGEIFNMAYGAIYDHHSEVQHGGGWECSAGLECYQKAYWITSVSSALGILVALWGIRHEHVLKRRYEQEDPLREA